MRQIDLKVVSSQVPELTGAAVLLAVVEHPSGQGFSVQDIEVALRLKKEIAEATDGTAIVSETDWSWLKNQMAGFRFSVIDQVFLDLNKNLTEAALIG